MKNLTKTILGGLAIGFISCALFSQQAQAAQINGAILLGGRATFDAPLGSATTVTQWFDVFQNLGSSSVLAKTGDFSFVPPLSSATMATPWVFNPSTSTQSLWEVGIWTFDLTSATIVTQLPNFINVEGAGIIHGVGFDDTPGTFQFTVTEAGIIAFTRAVPGVPDGGSAVALLGLALIGIEGLRRKLRARKG